jgi:glutathione synthase/RimK-type ligase-like ATP-grasp enzyme
VRQVEKRIALVTCSKYPNLTESDRILAGALTKAGADAVAVDWRDPSVQWSNFNLAVVRSTWDYHLYPDEFSAWIDHVATATHLVNSAGMMQWNRNKGRYLIDLLGCGISVVDFTVVEPGNTLPYRRLYQFDWNEVVVKPLIGASAWQIMRVAAEDFERSIPSELQASGYIVQPFLPEIEAGEYSVIFFNCEYSHTVLKKPRPGDFRTQTELGGSVELVHPSDSVIQQATKIVRRLFGRPTYARIDGIVRDGRFLLMEAELIEPELYFHLAPNAANTFASTLLALIQDKRR